MGRPTNSKAQTSHINGCGRVGEDASVMPALLLQPYSGRKSGTDK